MIILDTLHDPQLFQRFLCKPATWVAWRAFLGGAKSNCSWSAARTWNCSRAGGVGTGSGQVALFNTGPVQTCGSHPVS
jgi:hypothetical protein